MSFIQDYKNLMKGKNNSLMKLIVLNVIVFIASNLIIEISKLSGYNGSFIYRQFGLSPDGLYFFSHIWTLITYMFLHADVMHILFNMLWLFWMGQLFVEYVGNKHFISTYFMGGMCGGILFLLCGFIFPTTLAGLPLIGASAAVMAIVVAIAFLIPNYVLHLFLVGPVKLKYIALTSFILTSLIDLNNNTGGKIAHIGGALYGYVFIVCFRKGIDIGKPIHLINDWLMDLFKKPKDLQVVWKKPVSDETYNSNKRVMEKRTDEILDKISKSGYDGLSKEEKEFLFRQSK